MNKLYQVLDSISKTSVYGEVMKKLTSCKSSIEEELRKFDNPKTYLLSLEFSSDDIKEKLRSELKNVK